MPEPRAESFAALREDGAFDVIVVGGGINGIGVFRELALQGLRVLLVERNDFCSGCSAAPSRMIHGGLRYLENGEFDLVRESLRERDALLRNAPHLVRPLPTTIPITSVFSGLMNGVANFLGRSSRPANRGAVPVKIGLSIYDWVSRKRRVLPRHRFLSARETLRHWPKLSPKVRFSAVYYDAWISHPERLGIELLLDTRRLAGSTVALNYAEIASHRSGFLVTDRETGERYPVTARALVNATGAWLDESLAELVNPADAPERLITGTKGSHLVLDNRELYEALNGHMVYFGNSDGRVCIVFAYLGKVLAGSTDIKVESTERVRCEDDERDYILESLRLVFPTIDVSADQVVYSFSGIRPLARSDHDFTGRMSRGHFLQRIDATVPHFCMIGGKWTTFRAFAEHTTDAVLAELGRQRTTGTFDLAIGGGQGYSDGSAIETELVRTFGVTAARAAHLVDTYGTRADGGHGVLRGAPRRPAARRRHRTDRRRDRLPHAAGIRGAARRLDPAPHDARDHRHNRHRADRGHRLRRGRELGWDEARRRAEIEELIVDLENYHGVDRSTLDQRTKERTAPCL